MKETLSSQSAECSVTVTVTQLIPDTLQLNYLVRNHADSALYLCNLLYETTQENAPGQQVETEMLLNRVHVQITEEGVRVDKAIMDLSFHDGISVLDIPLLTRLEPGQEYEQSISLSLPLMPYKVRDSRPSQQLPTPMPLQFALGYLVESLQMQEAIREVPTSIGKAFRMEQYVANKQQIVSVGPFHEPLPVINGAGNGVKQPVSNEAWTPWG